MSFFMGSTFDFCWGWLRGCSWFGMGLICLCCRFDLLWYRMVSIWLLTLLHIMPVILYSIDRKCTQEGAKYWKGIMILIIYIISLILISRYISTSTISRASSNIKRYSSNSTAYTKLLNSLILNRREKNNKLQKLKSSHGYQLTLRKSVDHSEFKEMEEKTGKEEEVKNTLER